MATRVASTVGTARPAFVSVSAAAELFAVHRNTIRKWIGSGVLEAVKIGGCVRIRGESIEAVAGPKPPARIAASHAARTNGHARPRSAR